MTRLESLKRNNEITEIPQYHKCVCMCKKTCLYQDRKNKNLELQYRYHPTGTSNAQNRNCELDLNVLQTQELLPLFPWLWIYSNHLFNNSCHRIYSKYELWCKHEVTHELEMKWNNERLTRHCGPTHTRTQTHTHYPPRCRPVRLSSDAVIPVLTGTPLDTV